MEHAYPLVRCLKNVMQFHLQKQKYESVHHSNQSESAFYSVQGPCIECFLLQHARLYQTSQALIVMTFQPLVGNHLSQCHYLSITFGFFRTISS